jgi:hypothetical protein
LGSLWSVFFSPPSPLMIQLVGLGLLGIGLLSLFL